MHPNNYMQIKIPLTTIAQLEVHFNNKVEHENNLPVTLPEPPSSVFVPFRIRINRLFLLAYMSRGKSVNDKPYFHLVITTLRKNMYPLELHFPMYLHIGWNIIGLILSHFRSMKTSMTSWVEFYALSWCMYWAWTPGQVMYIVHEISICLKIIRWRWMILE